MKKGFTLVELSIVLVIIGLLIGGILVAQSMIGTAKVNSQIQQIQQIEIAVNNFKTSYNSLPGDSHKLGAGGAQPGATTAGDNDGKIQGYLFHNNIQADKYNLSGNHQWLNSTGWRSEWASVFDHLAVTRMYKFEPYNETDITAAVRTPGIFIPKMVLDANTSAGQGGGVVVGYEPGLSYMNPAHKIKLGWCSNFNCAPSAIDALAIDQKLDDGKPYSGKTYITNKDYTFRIPGGLTGDETSGCGNSVTNSYRTATKNVACVVTIETGF